MEPQVMGGLIQDIITKFFKDYILNLKPDLSKINVAMNKQGFGLWCDSFKDMISGTLDDSAWDAVKQGYGVLLDHFINAQPVKMGDPVETKSTAEAFLGTLPGTVDAACKEKILQYPQIVAALKKLKPEKALKVANDPGMLDRLIQILLDWGPLFLKIAMMILPFFI